MAKSSFLYWFGPWLTFMEYSVWPCPNTYLHIFFTFCWLYQNRLQQTSHAKGPHPAKKNRRLKLTCLEASESLGGGNSYISNFYPPKNLGKRSNFTHIFRDGLVETTNQNSLCFQRWFFFSHEDFSSKKSKKILSRIPSWRPPSKRVAMAQKGRKSTLELNRPEVVLA